MTARSCEAGPVTARRADLLGWCCVNDRGHIHGASRAVAKRGAYPSGQDGKTRAPGSKKGKGSWVCGSTTSEKHFNSVFGLLWVVPYNAPLGIEQGQDTASERRSVTHPI